MLKFSEDFIKNYDEDSDKGYIFEANVNYPNSLHDSHSDLPFLPYRMKINKCSKPVCKLYDKNNYVVQIRSLKQALDQGLTLKKVHRVIQFNQDAWHRKYQNNAKIWYMDTDSFIISIKTEDFYEDISDDVEKRFDTSNYEVNR